MKMAALAGALWLLSLLILQGQNCVLLGTDAEGKTAIVGDSSLLEGAYPPASTFKLLIAWAALKQGVAMPSTPHLCADQGRQEVGMAQAMYFSSNDYFRWLGLQLNRDAFEALIRESGWGGAGVKPGVWLADGEGGVERGGKLLVTVEQVHALTLRLMNLKSDPLSNDLRTVMRRPWNDPQSRVYGKSGAWGGAVWMTGYYDAPNPQDRKAVTVFVPYVVPDWKPAREKAQAEFYKALGVARPKS